MEGSQKRRFFIFLALLNIQYIPLNEKYPWPHMAVTDNYSCFGETKLFRFCFNCHTCKKTHCPPPLTIFSQTGKKSIYLKCRCCGFSAWNCWLCVVLRGSRILRGAPCSRVLRGAPCSRRGEVAPRDGRGGARPPGDEGREVVGDRDLKSGKI